MKITLNISDGVLDVMKSLGITDENTQEEMVIEFINDSLDSQYHMGMTDKFKKWTLKKDNIESFLENQK